MSTMNCGYLKTTPGICRVVLVATGFLGVVVASIAAKSSDWVEVKATCPIWTCPPPWLAQVGVCFVALTWVFTIIMLFGSIIPTLSSGPGFKKADFVGHTISGLALTTAFVFFTTFVILTLLFARCDEFTFSGSTLQQHVQKIECRLLEDNKGHIFQPILFSFGAIIALGNGILSIYITKASRESGGRPVPGVVMSTGIQSGSQGGVVHA